MLFLNLLVNGLISGCAIGVVAITFSMIYSTTRVFHVAHAGIYTLTGYVTWYLSSEGLPFWLSLACAVVAGAAMGAFIQSQLYSRLGQRRATPLVLLIASLGTLVVIQNVMAALFSPDVLQMPPAWRNDTIQLSLVTISLPQALIAISGLVLFVALLLWSRRSTIGKRMRAVAANEFLAEITRLEPRRVHVIIMAIASGMIAFPSAFTGLDQGLQPYTGTLVLLTATVAVIAGGMDSLVGAFVTSIILSVLQTTSTVVISGQWSVAATFGLFVILMVVAPKGIFARRTTR